jgi:MFS transporter, SP family, sugar:H+ symporter
MNESSHRTGFIVLITAVAAIGGFLFGFDSGVINGTFEGLRIAFGSSNLQNSFNVASMLLGCAAGAFIAGRAADAFGRRFILIVSALFFLVSAWGSGIAHSSQEFIVYRLLGGLAVGAASVLAPAYISEIAPPKIRGRLSSVQQIAIITGLFGAMLSNFFIAKHAGSALNIFAWGFNAWRWMFWVEIIPAATFFFTLLGIPESPRYLVTAGKKEKALAVLTRLMGETSNVKYEEIKKSLAEDHKPSFRDLVGPNGCIRPLVWLGIGIASFQQFVGINAVYYYGTVIWQAVGFTEEQALLTGVITNGASILGCIIATSVIDSLGRKKMLLIGSLGMFAALGVLTVVFSTAVNGASGELKLTGAGGPVALTGMILYTMFFNFSWGPVMWVMLGEMFPNQYRGSALAVSGLAQWGSNFIVSISFPVLLQSIGLGVSYGLYTTFALLSFFFIGKFAHETKGTSIDEIEG